MAPTALQAALSATRGVDPEGIDLDTELTEEERKKRKPSRLGRTAKILGGVGLAAGGGALLMRLLRSRATAAGTPTPVGPVDVPVPAAPTGNLLTGTLAMAKQLNASRRPYNRGSFASDEGARRINEFSKGVRLPSLLGDPADMRRIMNNMNSNPLEDAEFRRQINAINDNSRLSSFLTGPR